MGRLWHKVRDCIHGFVVFDNLEKRLIDSTPFQRLKSIHQLATSFQVYPGAVHTRFEHSLGVMAVADRIFKTVFDGEIRDEVRDRIADELGDYQKRYWQRVIRVAALLHDIGHLPFSHAAEEDLLPEGWNHERLTAEMIRQSEIADILQDVRPQIVPDDVVDLAWDVKKRSKVDPNYSLTPWRTLLNEIITGNTFGADRIDYLLRDSWHSGVGYGRFDPDRLIDGLRVVIDPNNDEIALGLDIGSMHSAEALLLARYFMYTQVYFHDVRRAYDLHLKDFLLNWLEGGKFPADWKKMLGQTDHEVLAALREAASDPGHRHHELAERLMSRRHFRTVYELSKTHKEANPRIFEDVRDLVRGEYGEDKVRSDHYGPKSETNDFLVLMEDGTVASSLKESGVIAQIPAIEIGLVFVPPDLKDKANAFIKTNLPKLLAATPAVEGQDR
jgi:HD superfamily phosphohydrolase